MMLAMNDHIFLYKYHLNWSTWKEKKKKTRLIFNFFFLIKKKNPPERLKNARKSILDLPDSFRYQKRQHQLRDKGGYRDREEGG